jgi:hypothetical protein
MKEMDRRDLSVCERESVCVCVRVFLVCVRERERRGRERFKAVRYLLA